MSTKLFFFCFLTLLLTACEKNDNLVPDSASIEYGWHTKLTDDLMGSIRPVIGDNNIMMTDINLDISKQKVFFINKETGDLEGTWDDFKDYGPHGEGGFYYYDNILIVNVENHVFGVDVTTRQTIWDTPVPNIGSHIIHGNEENIFHLVRDNGDKSLYHRTIYAGDSWEKIMTFSKKEEFVFDVRNFTSEKSENDELLLYFMEDRFSSSLDSTETVIYGYNLEQDTLFFATDLPASNWPGEPIAQPLCLGSNNVIATRGMRYFGFNKRTGEFRWEQNINGIGSTVRPIVNNNNVYFISGDAVNNAFYILDANTGRVKEERETTKRSVNSLVYHNDKIYYTDNKDLIIRDAFNGIVRETIRAPFVDDNSNLFFDGASVFDPTTNSLYTFDWRNLIRYDLP